DVCSSDLFHFPKPATRALVAGFGKWKGLPGAPGGIFGSSFAWACAASDTPFFDAGFGAGASCALGFCAAAPVWSACAKAWDAACDPQTNPNTPSKKTLRMTIPLRFIIGSSNLNT